MKSVMGESVIYLGRGRIGLFVRARTEKSLGCAASGLSKAGRSRFNVVAHAHTYTHTHTTYTGKGTGVLGWRVRKHATCRLSRSGRGGRRCY